MPTIAYVLIAVAIVVALLFFVLRRKPALPQVADEQPEKRPAPLKKKPRKERPEPKAEAKAPADEAPDKRGGRFRSEPLEQPLAELREGSLIVVRHEELKRGGKTVGAGVGRWIAREMVDATSGEPRRKLFLRGTIPPAELDLSESEWASFRPLGRLTREEG